MHKHLKKHLFLVSFLLAFLFSSTVPLSHAQLSGCAQIPVGNPSGNESIPPQCQSQGVTCNNVTEMDDVEPFTDSRGFLVSATVWNCDHNAPLVVFIPGRGRVAVDYARYEK